MQRFEEKTMTSKKIFEGNIIDVQLDEVRLPNGETAQRELVYHPGAVAIIPITPDNKIVLVEQYRKPLERTLVEIPAGKLEQNENPLTAAVRELEEETGYTTTNLSQVTSFYTSPGFANELVYVYVTNDLIKMENPPAGDDDEFVEIMEVTLDEAKDLVEKGRIQDAKTNYAVLYLHALTK
ncbi:MULTISPECIES: NUDIX hydrolase [Oceanobacillus]|uniref:ADP-ribose pyrophosphatase n=2 Tax=Oceanobacillus TaxID=182709 RepID=A0A0A1MYJ7_9BACI|nr:NUDIX hydrolase [Oceanobacillus oncorhynchi]MDM8100379.1 NUDIX hydrolase [Oceanobacillus oncorhynchi]UUI38153.1 NUDIX hydrolase [Oceanobacillus oncorhynchi]CEI83811.1 ADP-ribose pyrophosphatase [Oceanobacillus oncorhynchi]